LCTRSEVDYKIAPQCLSLATLLKLRC